MANENCLAGIACPNCGSEGPFRISASAIFLVFDDGTEEHGGLEWDGDSYCCCPECGHEAYLSEFQSEGGDHD